MKSLKLIGMTFFVLALTPVPSSGQNSSFTYQGQLQESSRPAAGSYQLQFSLHNSASGGAPLASTSLIAGVTNGLFTVPLDFGTASFDGSPRWLEISVRTNGSSGAFSILSPRQQITPTPYAISAQKLSGSISSSQLNSPIGSSQLSGTYSLPLSLNNPANSYSGSGDGLVDVNAFTLGGLTGDGFWKTMGNSGTAAQHFVGTTDDQPLEFRVNGVRAYKFWPTPSNSTRVGIVNVVGGSAANIVNGGVWGATIAGGGAINYNGSSVPNRVTDDFGTVGGGYFNTSAREATVGGGSINTSSGIYSTTAGGQGNRAQGYASFVGGGRNNTSGRDYSAVGGGEGNMAVGTYLHIGGGKDNEIITDYAVIGGGAANTNRGSFSVIAGGSFNSIVLPGSFSIVSGGYQNTNTGISTVISGGQGNFASGNYSVLAGGIENISSSYASTVGGGQRNVSSSVATVIGGGIYNASTNSYSTVGGGSGNVSGGVASTIAGGENNQAGGARSAVGGGAANQAAGEHSMIPGGYGNRAQGLFSLASGFRAIAQQAGSFVWADSKPFTFDPYAQTGPQGVTDSFNVRSSGGFYIATGVDATSGQITSGVYISAGGSGWNNLSDRNAKTNLVALDHREILERVISLPVQAWNYRSQDDSIRHIGPMAQDFNAAFDVGEPDPSGERRYINALDVDGVTLAAIQGLNQKLERVVQEKEARIADLEKAVTELKAAMDGLKQASGLK